MAAVAAGAGSSDAKQNAAHSTGASAAAVAAFTTPLKALEDDLKAKETKLEELNNKIDVLAKQQVEAIDADKKEKAQALEKQIARVEKDKDAVQRDKERVQRKIDALEADVRAARSPGAGAAAGGGDVKAAVGSGDHELLLRVAKDVEALKLQQQSSQTSTGTATASGALANTISSGVDYRAAVETGRIAQHTTRFATAQPATAEHTTAWSALLRQDLPPLTASEDSKFHSHFQALATKVMGDGKSALTLWHTFDQKTLAHAGVNSTAAALKPDFSVTGKGVSVTDLTTAVAVEVKKKKFDDAARAQTLGYGFAQMRAQKMRTLVYVALTNLRDIQLWRLRRAVGGGPIEVDEYAVEVLGSAEGFGTLAFLLNSDVSALGFTSVVVQSKEYEFLLTSVLGSGNSATVYAASERSGKLSAATATAPVVAPAGATPAVQRAAESAARKRAKAVAAAFSSPQRPKRPDAKVQPLQPQTAVWSGAVKVWHAGASAAQQFANELAVYERLNAAGCSGVLRMAAHSAQGEAPQWIALDGIGVAVRDLLVEDVQPLVAAIAAVHAHGVIHNDLRAKNVLRTAVGIKLCDFGCAAVVTTTPGSNGDAKGNANAMRVSGITNGWGASLTCSDAQLVARSSGIPQAVTRRDDYTALARAVFLQCKRPRPVPEAAAKLLEWWEQQHQRHQFLRDVDAALAADKLDTFATLLVSLLPETAGQFRS